MRVIDTNLLIYAVDEASEYQITCLRFLEEHGVSRICTHDADFHRFPFLSVIDPIRTGL